VIELLLQAERSLTVGQLDAAERVYWQAIESDPRNSIAVVGLARVALERGDDRAAYEFARTALEIDAENAAAQRLVSRLGEVMAFRGEQPPSGPTPPLARPTHATSRPTPTLPTDQPTAAASAPGSGPTPISRPTPVSGPTPGSGPTAEAKPSPKRRGFFGRILGR
jgi:hypothetical protein